jgi:hypothetical protein
MGKNLKLFSAEKEKFTKIFFKKILPRQKTPKKLPKNSSTHAEKQPL